MENKDVWYLYLLLCDSKIYYARMTNNLLTRIKNHREKNSLFTLRFNKIKLVYCESYDKKYQAAIREKQLKGWSRAKKQMLIIETLGISIYIELPKKAWEIKTPCELVNSSRLTEILFFKLLL